MLVKDLFAKGCTMSLLKILQIFLVWLKAIKNKDRKIKLVIHSKRLIEVPTKNYTHWLANIIDSREIPQKSNCLFLHSLINCLKEKLFLLISTILLVVMIILGLIDSLILQLIS